MWMAQECEEKAFQSDKRYHPWPEKGYIWPAHQNPSITQKSCGNRAFADYPPYKNRTVHYSNLTATSAINVVRVDRFNPSGLSAPTGWTVPSTKL